MFFDKVVYGLIISCLSGFSAQAYAAVPNPSDEQPALNITVPVEAQDIGIYILSKVTDAKTGEPLENAQVSANGNNVNTDSNGEFFLKVNPSGNIVINKEKYQEAVIQVSALRGKIKLNQVPDYLPIFPNLSAGINYRNLGVVEKLDKVSATGRFNDSFSIDAQGKLLNSILVALTYENTPGIFNRQAIKEQIKFSNHLVSLKGAYIFNIFEDRLDISAGVKGYWNSIGLEFTPNQIERTKDYLDFGSQRLGIGAELELGGRPIRYTPFVLGGSFAYYPIISVTQPQGGTLPTTLNGVDYGVFGRYDLFGGYVKLGFNGKYLFSGNYNYSLAGLTLGIGYGF